MSLGMFKKREYYEVRIRMTVINWSRHDLVDKSLKSEKNLNV